MREPAFWWRPAGLASGLLAPLGRDLRRGRGGADGAARAARRHAGDLRRQSHARRRRQDADRDRGGADAATRPDARPFLLSRGYGGALPGRCRSIRRGTAPPRSATSRCCWRASRRPSWRATASAGADAARAAGAGVDRDGRRLPEPGPRQGLLASLVVDGRARHRQRPGVSGRAAARAAGGAASPRAGAAGGRRRARRASAVAARPRGARPAGVPRPAGAGRGGARRADGPAGAGLRRHRRSGKILRHARAAPASTSAPRVASPIITATGGPRRAT